MFTNMLTFVVTSILVLTVAGPLAINVVGQEIITGEIIRVDRQKRVFRLGNDSRAVELKISSRTTGAHMVVNGIQVTVVFDPSMHTALHITAVDKAPASLQSKQPPGSESSRTGAAQRIPYQGPAGSTHFRNPWRRMARSRSNAAQMLNAHFAAGKLAKAESSMRELLTENQHDATARFGLGVTEFLQAVESLVQTLHQSLYEVPSSAVPNAPLRMS